VFLEKGGMCVVAGAVCCGEQQEVFGLFQQEVFGVFQEVFGVFPQQEVFGVFR